MKNKSVTIFLLLIFCINNECYLQQLNKNSNKVPAENISPQSYINFQRHIKLAKIFSNRTNNNSINNIPEDPNVKLITVNDNGFNAEVGHWDPITRTATLSQDLYKPVLISGKNITFDGSAHVISGNGFGTGIYIADGENIIVKNTIIKKYYLGILVQPHYLTDTSKAFLQSNIISDNLIKECSQGINIYGSSGNKLKNNIVDISYLEMGSLGIGIFNSDKNELINNKIKGTNQDYSFGLLIQSSKSNIIHNNNMKDCIFNFTLWGSEDSDFYNNIDTSNTVNGKPIYYMTDVSDYTLDNPSVAGTIYIINGKNVTIRKQDLQKNGVGIYLRNTSSSRIEDNNASYNMAALYMEKCSDNVFQGNTWQFNLEGVRVHSSQGNLFKDNKIEKNINPGILFFASNNNSISSNKIQSNGSGIMCFYSDGNTLESNQIESNVFYGIYITEHPATDGYTPSNIFQNTIKSNMNFGIFVDNTEALSQKPEIFHNNFIDNNRQAVVTGECTFCKQLPIGGNYWNNWSAPDNNLDGFIDSSFNFQGGVDKFPWSRLDGWIEKNFITNTFPGNNSQKIPKDYSLYPNYPNPFNPETKIKFDLPKNEYVILKIYDCLGNEVATLVDRKIDAGTYEFTWSAAAMPSGIYLYKLKTENYFIAKKMILLK